MKRIVLLFTVVCLLAVIYPLSVCADSSVTVSDAAGFTNALETLEDGGTIHVNGTVALAADFQWDDHDKSLTITGGTLDFSKLNDVILGDSVQFDSIKLIFTEGSSLFANGHPLYIGKSVTVTGEPTVYGGGKFKAVDSTNLTLLSGTYTDIFGGSKIGSVRGDVLLNVGGHVNADLNSISHKHTYCVYGGCDNGKVTGKVTLNFGGAARANYIYGGCLGVNSRIEGGIEVAFSGGKAVSICGGSRNAFHECDVNVTMTGGSVEQVFGGSEHATHAGNVSVNILGGTITRRVYGGCYNEVTASGEWESKNYVVGDIYLTIGSGARINFTTGSADRAIYAHSRQATLSNKENSYIRFTDEDAYNKYYSKLGAQDSMMQSIMSGVSAADVILELSEEKDPTPTPQPFPWYPLLALPVILIGLILFLIIKRNIKKRHP